MLNRAALLTALLVSTAAALFVGVDHGRSWVRDVSFARVTKDGPYAPVDSPVMCPLKDGKVLVVIQGTHRHLRRKADDESPDMRMSLIGNIIEPWESKYLFIEKNARRG